MPQTAYTQNLAAGFAGQISDISFKRIRTGVNAVGAGIPFGVGVKKGTNEGEVLLPTGSGDKIIGINIHSHDVDQRNLTGVQGTDIGADCNIMEEGCCLVLVEETVVEGDPVYCRYATGTGTQLGAFRKSADTSTAAAVKGAQFRRGATAGNLAEVEFSKMVNLS